MTAESRQERLLRREARRKASRRRHRIATLLVTAAAVTSFVGTLLVVHFTQVLEPAQMPPTAPAMLASAPTPVKAPAIDPTRPVFRYSIVPGGVRSSAEVIRAMQQDPVVAKHYASVIPAFLRPEKLPSPVSVHVSYRVGDKVYWTKKKLTLNAGEPVLTDGATMLRERCGNIMSLEPLAPALEPAAEPDPPEFDLQVDPYAPEPGTFALLPPPPPAPLTGPPPSGVPPGLPPGVPTPFSAPPTAPLPVPEPGTWVLVTLGLGIGLVRLLKR